MSRKQNLFAAGLVLTSLSLGLAGCAGQGATTKQQEQQEQQALQEQNSGMSEAILSGKVIETMDSGGYTYVCLEKQGKMTWAALPVTKLKLGQELRIYGGAEMPQFTSKALNRTFDIIVFSGGVLPDAPADQATAHPAPPPAAALEQKQAKVEKPVLKGKITETMRVGTYTYVYLEDSDGRKTWSAVPASDVKVGEEIELLHGIDMVNFKSTALKRTFDYIHFSGGIKGAKERAEKAAAEAAALKASLPEGHPSLNDPAKGAQAPAKPKSPPITGKVVETSNAGGYTYICLEKEGVKTWAAVPAMKVTVGEELTLAPGNVMKNFFSKSLKRTFEQIVFTSRPVAQN